MTSPTMREIIYSTAALYCIIQYLINQTKMTFLDKNFNYVLPLKNVQKDLILTKLLLRIMG